MVDVQAALGHCKERVLIPYGQSEDTDQSADQGFLFVHFFILCPLIL